MSAPPVKVAVVGLAIAAGLVMVLGIAHVHRRQEVIHLGYELSKVTEELSRAQEENRRLRLEKAALTNPERVRRLAESLGMSQPGPTQIRVVREGDELAHRSGGEPHVDR